VLGNLAGYWSSGDLESKNVVSKLVFNRNPAYERDKGFGTPDTTVLVTLCGDSRGTKVPDVEKGGVEPPCNLGQILTLQC